MTRPLIWNISNDYPMADDDDMTGTYQSESEFDLFGTTLGEPFSHPNAPLKFDFSQASSLRLTKYDLLVGNEPVPIVSKRMADLLRSEALYDVSFFDAEVICRDRAVHSFCVVHIRNMVEALDQPRSIPVLVRGIEFPVGWQTVSLRDDCMAGSRIGREKSYAQMIVVDEALGKAIMKLRPLGLSIIRDIDYP